MTRHSLPIVFLLMSTTLLLAASPAAARLRGDIELGYVSYEAEEKGARVADAHTLSQKYSVMYEKDGEIYNRRFGFYRAALGYEWASFDSRVYNPEDGATRNPSTSAGKILFDGELVLDPLELPLRVKAYSRDTTTSSFTLDSLPELNGQNRILDPNIVTSLNGTGRNVVTGATMVLGVKNGLTNGYNAIFRHIPMVLLDYRDERHEDLKSQTPVNTRMRKLAFVSLNKRDNWFHYRTTRFEDYINPSQGYLESQVQLGTVDHTLQRRWIDLTNWIKISTDVQYTKRGSTSDAYDVNFFAVAQRKNWDARSFLNFSRERSGDELRYERSIPLYVSGTLGADSSWNAGISHRDREVKENSLTLLTDRNTSATFRLESFKRSPFTLTQKYVVENATSNGNDTLGLEALVETRSTRRFSDRYTAAASYNVRYLKSDQGVGESSYLFQNIVGRMSYTPFRGLTLNLDESVTMTQGNSAALTNTASINAQTGFGSPNDVFRRETGTDGYTRSVTSAGVSWAPLPRLTVSLTATEDVLLHSGQSADYLTTINNRVDYTLDNLRLNMENRIALRSDANGNATYLQNIGSAQYTPNKYLEALVRYVMTKNVSDGDNSTYIDLTERVTYSLYQRSGQQRKLLELTQEFTMTDSDVSGVAASTTGKKRLLLGARYYALRNLYIGGNAAYALLTPGNSKEFVYNGYVGLNYRKLQINVDYSYGKRSNDDTRVEKRLMASMRKSF